MKGLRVQSQDAMARLGAVSKVRRNKERRGSEQVERRGKKEEERQRRLRRNILELEEIQRNRDQKLD